MCGPLPLSHTCRCFIQLFCVLVSLRSDPASIYLISGGSAGISTMLQVISAGSESDGFMIPVPQYPAYSAFINLLGATLIGYELDEQANWGIDVSVCYQHDLNDQ